MIIPYNHFFNVDSEFCKKISHLVAWMDAIKYAIQVSTDMNQIKELIVLHATIQAQITELVKETVGKLLPTEDMILIANTPYVNFFTRQMIVQMYKREEFQSLLSSDSEISPDRIFH